MRFFSMFTGSGGFEIGIQRAMDNKSKNEQLQTKQNKCSDNSNLFQGTTSCVGYSEIDKYACQVMQKQYGGIKNYGDATKIKPEELPDFDLLVGGTPCQDFSIAGKRKGMFKEDGTLTRSGLYYELLRVVHHKKPKLVLLENVKGMLSSKNKTTGEYNFDNMMEALCDEGYAIDFTILNSKFFGVPQHRERTFVLAIREDFLSEQEII